MIKKYSKKSLLFGSIGIIGEFAVVALVIALHTDLSSPNISNIIMIISGVFGLMVLVALYYYLKAKGRSQIWLLALFFNLIGIIVLGLLKDKNKIPKEYKEQCDKIIEVIKANPKMTFENAKKQAIKAGIPEDIFNIAWNNSKVE